jgi:hypothetical protein
MGSAVCWRCVEDRYLQERVRAKGAVSKCALCDGQTENAFNADELAKTIAPIFRKLFIPGHEDMDIDGAGREYWTQQGEKLADHLPKILRQTLGFEDEIVELLIRNEQENLKDGNQLFFEVDALYEENVSVSSHFDTDWTSVSEELKHRRRFFSSAAASLFDKLFDDVESLSHWNAKTKAEEPVVFEFPQGFPLFRARILDSKPLIDAAHGDPQKHVGPPRPETAKAGRMNVEGVAVFYGATDLKTCLAEVRPALGSDVAVITLETSKPLRVLDFTRLKDFYSDPSYFQPDYSEQLDRGAFLRRLQRLISQPVIPGREQDYLITQTMTEYLAHVHGRPFEGILFESAQRSGGTNVVLFPDAKGEFSLSYVQGSFQLCETLSIEYEHKTISVHRGADGIVLYRSSDFFL